MVAVVVVVVAVAVAAVMVAVAVDPKLHNLNLFCRSGRWPPLRRQASIVWQLLRRHFLL